MNFIHAIDLYDFYPCHNIGIDGKLMSPGFLSKADPDGIGQFQKQITDFSIEQLKLGHAGLGVITPRFANVCIETALLRQNKPVINGYGDETLYSDETKELKIKYADAELAFENIRREQFPEQVSRLACIYLAERTDEGRSLVQEMLGDHVEVMDVKIVHLFALSQVDVSWFDSYIDEANDEFIVKYWNGQAQTDAPKWEYLLEGMIEIEDNSLINVLDNGATID
ncbi:hypothetical protein ACED51_16080 [Photobacterium swingsii]|uniref:hypothetical protein n=1 Tax=Photobacterium swingsii TaxID=680026 RepID=UPI00352F8565